MSRGFYNYDTRGASPSTQIINLERMVEEREERINKLQDALAEAEKEIERLRTENTMT
jgi:hypothetical protein